MLIGHFAPALVAAALPRAPRLGPLVLATMLVDFALFALILLDVEHWSIQPGLTRMSPYDLWDVGWSHSLVGTLGWAAGFAVAVKLLTRDARAAWIGAGVVVSHWLLDLVVHPPDLTILGTGVRHGWGLWDHPYIAMPLELLLAFTAFAFFVNRTRAIDWRGRWATGLLAGVVLAFQLAAWVGRQPVAPVFRPSASVPVTVLAAMTIITVLAWWVGDLREKRAR
ncbi:MAG TPA: hypothetical protein VF695_00320 [Sphingomonas sp.]|jgi:hypothetical protein